MDGSPRVMDRMAAGEEAIDGLCDKTKKPAGIAPNGPQYKREKLELQQLSFLAYAFYNITMDENILVVNKKMSHRRAPSPSALQPEMPGDAVPDLFRCE
jgi:hypothetical protein